MLNNILEKISLINTFCGGILSTMYEFKDKFALVTGGGQGIGLAYVRELLLNGIKGVSLVDINRDAGLKSTLTLNEEFGDNRVIFVHADVSKSDQFEDAFKKSTAHWNFVDIVINNAGVIDENNWNLCISVNCEGTVHGTLLGFQYMSKRNGGRGGVIVNTSSLSGIEPYFGFPIYCATKSFIITLCRSFGTRPYFDHNGVKILTVCPHATDTRILVNTINNVSVSVCPNIRELMMNTLTTYAPQPPERVAKGMINAIKTESNGSVWLIEEDQALYEVQFPTRMSKTSN